MKILFTFLKGFNDFGNKMNYKFTFSISSIRVVTLYPTRSLPYSNYESHETSQIEVSSKIICQYSNHELVGKSGNNELNYIKHKSPHQIEELQM